MVTEEVPWEGREQRPIPRIIEIYSEGFQAQNGAEPPPPRGTKKKYPPSPLFLISLLNCNFKVELGVLESLTKD